jgi:hypothetical protein
MREKRERKAAKREARAQGTSSPSVDAPADSDA